MFKRLILSLLAAASVWAVVGCGVETTTATTVPTTATTTTETTTLTTVTTTTTESTTTTTVDLTVELPDLTGLSRTQITAALAALDLTVKFYFDVSVVYTDESQYDKFVRYGQDMVAGTEVMIGTEIRVYTTPLYLSTQYYDHLGDYQDDEGNSLQLVESDYQGQEFIADGIGVVTVYRYVDGDTTWFDSEGTSFSVRYLGIDTPESTALYEPWGKAAAIYTQARLSNAETIVLQAEGERMDGNGRYLAWVWYRYTAESDFILLNLEWWNLPFQEQGGVGSASRPFSPMRLERFLTKRASGANSIPITLQKEGTQMSIRYRWRTSTPMSAESRRDRNDHRQNRYQRFPSDEKATAST